MKLVTIIGARPQFIKASSISNIIKDRDDITEIIINTGQHFDSNMSDIFFNELDIPKPDYNLDIHSLSHGHMTGLMIKDIESLLIKENPNMILVYGDTNSTLSGALAASKLHIPIAHVEAGMRSYDKTMPEEINRILTDHVSSLLFCSTIQSVKNLLKEGFGAECGIKLVGDVMYDVFLKYKNECEDRKQVNKKGKYCLLTIHREENTSDKKILYKILSMIQEAGIKFNINFIFPVHPRTKKLIHSIKEFDKILFSEPVSYLDMLSLEMNSSIIVTDSGGVQKEACWSGIDCITIRSSTEWVETLETGWNTLVGLNKDRFLSTIERLLYKHSKRKIPNYGDGNSAKKIVDEIIKWNS